MALLLVSSTVAKSLQKSSSRAKEREVPMEDGKHQLWTEKYRPVCMADLPLHGSKVRDIREWLKKAMEIHECYYDLGAQGPTCFLALAGNSGCGKTSTIQQLCGENNVQIIEWTEDMWGADNSNILMFESFDSNDGYRGSSAYSTGQYEAAYSSGYSNTAKDLFKVEGMTRGSYVSKSEALESFAVQSSYPALSLQAKPSANPNSSRSGSSVVSVVSSGSSNRSNIPRNSVTGDNKDAVSTTSARIDRGARTLARTQSQQSNHPHLINTAATATTPVPAVVPDAFPRKILLIKDPPYLDSTFANADRMSTMYNFLLSVQCPVVMILSDVSGRDDFSFAVDRCLPYQIKQRLQFDSIYVTPVTEMKTAKILNNILKNEKIERSSKYVEQVVNDISASSMGDIRHAVTQLQMLMGCVSSSGGGGNGGIHNSYSDGTRNGDTICTPAAIQRSQSLPNNNSDYNPLRADTNTNTNVNSLTNINTRRNGINCESTIYDPINTNHPKKQRNSNQSNSSTNTGKNTTFSSEIVDLISPPSSPTTSNMTATFINNTYNTITTSNTTTNHSTNTTTSNIMNTISTDTIESNPADPTYTSLGKSSRRTRNKLVIYDSDSSDNDINNSSYARVSASRDSTSNGSHGTSEAPSSIRNHNVGIHRGVSDGILSEHSNSSVYNNINNNNNINSNHHDNICSEASSTARTTYHSNNTTTFSTTHTTIKTTSTTTTIANTTDNIHTTLSTMTRRDCGFSSMHSIGKLLGAALDARGQLLFDPEVVVERSELSVDLLLAFMQWNWIATVQAAPRIYPPIPLHTSYSCGSSSFSYPTNNSSGCGGAGEGMVDLTGDDHPNSANNTATDNYQYVSESEIAMKELAELEAALTLFSEIDIYTTKKYDTHNNIDRSGTSSYPDGYIQSLLCRTPTSSRGIGAAEQTEYAKSKGYKKTFQGLFRPRLLDLRSNTAAVQGKLRVIQNELLHLPPVKTHHRGDSSSGTHHNNSYPQYGNIHKTNGLSGAEYRSGSYACPPGDSDNCSSSLVIPLRELLLYTIPYHRTITHFMRTAPPASSRTAHSAYSDHQTLPVYSERADFMMDNLYNSSQLFTTTVPTKTGSAELLAGPQSAFDDFKDDIISEFD